MQLLTYDTIFEYIVCPMRRTVMRVHCKKTQLYAKFWLTGIMSMCKYSHMCSMCHVISPCFMTTSMFPRKYFDSMSCSHTSSYTERRVKLNFGLTEMCPSTVWHLVFHYFAWCEGTINVTFTLKTLIGRVYVQLLTNEEVSVCERVFNRTFVSRHGDKVKVMHTDTSSYVKSCT